MHDTQQDPVDVGQMIAWIADGETPDGQQKIGTEHEKFLFHRQTLVPVAYERARRASVSCWNGC